MKKITVNEIILAVTVSISLFMSIKLLLPFEVFNSVWSILSRILIIIFTILTPLILGFALALPLILFAKKINSKKTLRYLFYTAFILVLFFFAYYLYYFSSYENEIRAFEFEQRLRFFANDISNPFVRFFILTLQSCLEINMQFINLMTGFIISVYRKL